MRRSIRGANRAPHHRGQIAHRPSITQRGRALPGLSAVPTFDARRSRAATAYIMSMPPMPPGMPAPAGCFSGASATTASVVRMFFAIEAAF